MRVQMYYMYSNNCPQLSCELTTFLENVQCVIVITNSIGYEFHYILECSQFANNKKMFTMKIQVL